PSTRASIPQCSGLAFDATADDLPEVAVQQRYGEQNPARIDADFLDAGRVWKVAFEHAPPDATEITRRPLLAGRIEQAALDRILQIKHLPARRGRVSDLADADTRKELARRLHEAAMRLEQLTLDNPATPSED